MSMNIYKTYKKQELITRCSSCMGEGKFNFTDSIDENAIDCEVCKGTGLDFPEDNQQDKTFYLNLLKVFYEKNDWPEDAEYLSHIIQINPTVYLIDTVDREHTFTIVYKSHACYIEDGKLKRFF
jgi:hypothetical protein